MNSEKCLARRPKRWLVAGMTLALTFGHGAAIGSPLLKSVNSDPTEKSEVTITGLGFGEPKFDFIVLDESDHYIYKKDMKTLKPYPHSELWVQHGSTWANALVPQEVSEPGKATESVYYGEGKSYNIKLRPLLSESNNTLYMSWLFKPYANPGEHQGSNKFVRIWDSHSGNNTRQAWDQMHVVHWRKDVDPKGKIQWGGWMGSVGEWNRFELWMDAKSGKMTIHTNGKTAIDVDDFKKSDVPEGLNPRLIGFDPSFGDRYKDFKYHLDRIYVSNSRARIEISDSPIWTDDSRRREVQIPISWSNNTVKFEPSAQVLASKKPLYIYVTNENGEVNKRGALFCPRCPSTIVDLSVE